MLSDIQLREKRANIKAAKDAEEVPGGEKEFIESYVLFSKDDELS